MEISRRSWHYRLVFALSADSGKVKTDQGWILTPRSLCMYFWEVVMTLLVKVPTMTIMALGFCIALVAVVLTVVVVVVFLVAVVVAISPVILLITGICCLCQKLSGKPWLITQYLRAVKEKVCPLISWVD